jgi:hypothetical protein
MASMPGPRSPTNLCLRLGKWWLLAQPGKLLAEVVVARSGNVLTGSQEIESIAQIALVASKEKSTIFGRLLHGFLCLADLGSVRDAAADDHSVVVFEIGSGPHLASVGSEWTLVVLLAGLVVEVVGVVQRVVIVVVWVLVNGCSVSPAAHEVCGEFLGRLWVVGGERSLGRFSLQPTGLRVRLRRSHGGIDDLNLLVELRDLLLKLADDQEAAVCRPVRLTHGVAFMSAKDQSGKDQLMIRCREVWGM